MADEVKDPEAGNLVWAKENSTEIKDACVEFFLNPVVSNKQMRMEGLAKVLAKEIAFDATMEVINNPETWGKVTELYELQDVQLLGNELEIISKDIDRKPDFKFSKSHKSKMVSTSKKYNKLKATTRIEEYTRNVSPICMLRSA